jgi:hypothetical protein
MTVLDVRSELWPYDTKTNAPPIYMPPSEALHLYRGLLALLHRCNIAYVIGRPPVSACARTPQVCLPVKQGAYNIVCYNLLHAEGETIGSIPDLPMHTTLHWAFINQALAILYSCPFRCPRFCLLERLLHELLPSTHEQEYIDTIVSSGKALPGSASSGSNHDALHG